MGSIAKQNGPIPECLGSVSDHLHLCVSQLQETVHPTEQQLERSNDIGYERMRSQKLVARSQHDLVHRLGVFFDTHVGSMKLPCFKRSPYAYLMENYRILL
jgi:hypothetical protein